MFGIGSTELLVILLVALIVLGPKSLASVSRSLGKSMREFRRVSTDFQRALNVEAAEDERRLREEARARQKETSEKEDAGENTPRAQQAAFKIPESSQPESASMDAPAKVKVSLEKSGAEDETPLARAVAKTHAQAEAASKKMDAGHEA